MNGMTISFAGQLATVRGHAQQHDRAGTPDPFTVPSSSFFVRQPRHLPVFLNHDRTWQVGEIVHLERSASTGLLAVGVLDVDLADMLADGPWHLSPDIHAVEVDPMRYDFAAISEVSLTRSPATLGT